MRCSTAETLPLEHERVDMVLDRREPKRTLAPSLLLLLP
jgi:hypothetical protein